MRARESAKSAAAPEPVPPSARSTAALAGLELARHGRLSPKAAIALQRSVGNAAISRLIDAEQHRHGPGCGHGKAAPEAVQRSMVHDTLRESGEPLGGSLKSEMEARLGADFSDVRLHTGPKARKSAAEIGARAYTSGNHVVLGDSGADRHTVAHELVHVIQQRQGPVSGTDNGSGLKVSDPSDRFEREAEAKATSALSAPLQAEPAAAAADGVPVAVGGAPVQRAAAGGPAAEVVQRAGGHGGIKSRHGGQILQKPTNEVEAGFYGDVRSGAHPGYEGVVPQSYTAYQVSQMDNQTGGNDAEHIYIANLTHGMIRPRMIDIKIGSATASKRELAHALGSAAAFRKKMRLEVADAYTGSSSRGYRVVDGPGAEGSRAKVGRKSRSMVDEYSDSADVYRELVDQLRYVREVVRNGGLAHIAASVLIAVDEQPAEGHPVVRADSVKLIDFAHTFGPGQVSDDQLKKYRRRFDDGLTSLIHDMEASGGRKR